MSWTAYNSKGIHNKRHHTQITTANENKHCSLWLSNWNLVHKINYYKLNNISRHLCIIVRYVCVTFSIKGSLLTFFTYGISSLSSTTFWSNGESKKEVLLLYRLFLRKVSLVVMVKKGFSIIWISTSLSSGPSVTTTKNTKTVRRHFIRLT